MFIFYVALWFLRRGVSCWALASSFFLFFFFFFFSPVWHCAHLAWGRESWSLWFSCICLFILHALISVRFLFLFVSGLDAAWYCGSLWTFILLTFLSAVIVSDTMVIVLHSISLSKIVPSKWLRFWYPFWDKCGVEWHSALVTLFWGNTCLLIYFWLKRVIGSQNRTPGTGTIAW